MEKNIVGILAAFIFIVLVVLGMLSLENNHQKKLSDVSFVDRKYAVFDDDEVRRSMDMPFLMRMELHSESPTQALFDVTYFVPKNDAGVYGIKVYPSSSNFASAPNQLKPGENTVRIAVDFIPKSSFVRGEKTRDLRVYIYTQSEKVDSVVGEAFIKKIYERRVVFAKHWRKRKAHINALNPTQFHWK